MPYLFANPSHRVLSQHETLTHYLQSNTQFNSKDVAHMTLLNECIKESKQKLLVLQMVDKNIMKGFALGVAAFALSYLFPLSVVSTAGFLYGAYQMGVRRSALIDHQNALDNLTKCFQWALGNIHDRAIINEPTIKEMVNTLAPLTNEAQLRSFIDPKVESGLVKAASTTKASLTLMDHHLNQEEASLYFKIYGYEQGGVLALLQGLKYGLVNGYAALKDIMTTEPTTTALAS